MRIVPLVENTTKSELKAKHGLSLYIETKLHKILFDLGSDNTLFENAVKRNIDISKVDTVIISHGHFDHGGALKKFLDVNSSANIYVQTYNTTFHSIYCILEVNVLIYLRYNIFYIIKNKKKHEKEKFMEKPDACNSTDSCIGDCTSDGVCSRCRFNSDRGRADNTAGRHNCQGRSC